MKTTFSMVAEDVALEKPGKCLVPVLIRVCFNPTDPAVSGQSFPTVLRPTVAAEEDPDSWRRSRAEALGRQEQGTKKTGCC